MQKTVFVLLLLAISALAGRHQCIHDKMQKQPLLIADDPTPSAASEGEKDRRLAATSNIRIYTDFTYLTTGNSIVLEYLRNQVVASAVAYYQSVLSVVPYSGLIQSSSQCGGLNAPASLINGISNADLVILVTAGYSTDSYLAYASPCMLSKNGYRPIIGMINFNLNQVQTATNIDLEENLITTLHELAHVLAMSSQLFGFFIDPATGQKVAATDTTTVQGQTVTYFKLEPVLSKVRNYFNCQNLEGAYLENEGSEASAGSHWERKTFFNEIMTSSAMPDVVYTDLTLGVMEASGWYQVKYTNMFERFTWGKGKGCSFVRNSCMSGTSAAFTPEFCSPLQSRGCTFTGRSVAICGTGSGSVASSSSVPSAYNYWSNNTILPDTFANNCPYFLGYNDHDCEEPTDVSQITIAEEKYAQGSKCLTGTLSNTNSARSKTGYCFPITCNYNSGTDTYSLTVTVGKQIISCTSAQSVSVSGLAGLLDCPDPTDYCRKATPTYCARGCSGRGTCTNNACVCPTGWGGRDCGLRYYVDGCSRCAGNSAGTSCFGDGCSCNPSTSTCSGLALIGVGDGGVNRKTTSSDRVILSLSGLMMLAISVLFA